MLMHKAMASPTQRKELSKLTDSILLDQPWTDVTIVSSYVDRGNLIQKEVRVLKSEAEDDITERMRARAEADEDVKPYVMTNDEFQSQIFRAIQTMLATPIQGKTPTTNEVRLIPPTAYREVVIRVNNLGKVLTA